MKNPKPISAKAVCWLLLCLFVVIACKKEQKETNALAANAAADSCACESAWFPHSQTPAPAEGKGSPFDAASTTNCIFHQWSWQKFLWLTKPQQNNNPLFLNELTQVNDALLPVTKIAGASIVLNSQTDIEQAGTNAILNANPAYGASNPNGTDLKVYYSIHSNDIMMEAAQNFKDSLQAGTLPPNNLRTFPVGSLELKIAWIDVNAIAAGDQQNYFITTAAVTANGNTYQRKKVALLGMHVVGVVINHPEFIWATFQHKSLAPVYDWKSNQANSNTQQLLYAQGSTTGLDGITWSSGAPKALYKPYDLFHYGVPLSPGGQFMQTAQQEPMNFNNIQSINDCVAANLNDVWNNYFYNGSLWVNTDGLSPQQQSQLLVNQGGGISSALPGASARGSMNNANITMETYAQTFESDITDIAAGNLINCFSCHNAESFNTGHPKSPLYVSHIFNAYVAASQGKTRTQINSMKDREHAVKFGRKQGR